MLVVFINAFKSCEISNQMFFSVIFSFSKTKDVLVMIKYCKIKLFIGAISHCVSNESNAYLEPSQTSIRERFCKNSQQFKPLTFYAK